MEKIKVLDKEYSLNSNNDLTVEEVKDIENCYNKQLGFYAESGLNEHKDEASKLIDNIDELNEKMNKSEDKFKKLEEKLKKLPKALKPLAYIPIFLSLVRDFINKKYKTIPVGIIVAIVAALLYFLSPIDVIPDWIPGAGYIDDASVILFCLETCKVELDKYTSWRDKQ